MGQDKQGQDKQGQFSFEEVRDLFKKQEAKVKIDKTSEADESCVEQTFTAEEAKKLLDANEAMKQPIVGYRMYDKMGSGGMATVFKAQDMASKEWVALKLLFPGLEEDKNALATFIREGVTLLKLDHPNILRGKDFGVSNGFYFLAMELIDGESLVDFLNSGLVFTELYAFEITVQIAKALQHLEEHQIVHRDIKPANILLTAKEAKLCDFGLSLDRSSKRPDQKENADVTCGTVEYISPEQARGGSMVDIRSDIYSLGITCFHMVTGKVPFSSEDPREVMRMQIYEKVDFDHVDRKFSPASAKVLEKMVRKSPNERYQNATELVQALEVLLKKGFAS